MFMISLSSIKKLSLMLKLDLECHSHSEVFLKGTSHLLLVILIQL